MGLIQSMIQLGDVASWEEMHTRNATTHPAKANKLNQRAVSPRAILCLRDARQSMSAVMAAASQQIERGVRYQGVGGSAVPWGRPSSRTRVCLTSGGDGPIVALEAIALRVTGAKHAIRVEMGWSIPEPRARSMPN